MRQKWSLLVFFALIYLISLAFLRNYYRQQIQELTIKINQVKTKKTTVVPTLSSLDLSLTAEKNRIRSQSGESLISFNSQVSRLDINRRRIEIVLTGDDQAVADAADLVINLPLGIVVDKITPDDAFPLYPRIKQTGQQLLMTGLASIKDGEIILGKVNRRFCTVDLRIPESSNLPAVLYIDENNSNIYFSGNNITDKQNSNYSIIIN